MKFRLMSAFSLAILLSAGLALAMPGDVHALGDSVPMGQALEGLRFPSTILGRDVNYAVYLPPDYATSGRRYPVVYLLHGYTDNESAWIQFGEVNMAADRAIADRDIPPKIIVMPDGGISWYINDYQNKVRYEDMFIQEFIPYIDRTYRTRPEKEFRGISGLSMGGWGALVHAMRHPDLFAACAAFSAAVWTDEDFMAMDEKLYGLLISPILGPNLTGKDRLTPLTGLITRSTRPRPCPVMISRRSGITWTAGMTIFCSRGTPRSMFCSASEKSPMNSASATAPTPGHTGAPGSSKASSLSARASTDKENMGTVPRRNRPQDL